MSLEDKAVFSPIDALAAQVAALAAQVNAETNALRVARLTNS